MGKQKKQPEGLPGWMATYGDLVTLLLCFFVLLFAMSSINTQKFRDTMLSFKGTFGVLKGGETLTNEMILNQARSKAKEKGIEMRFKQIAIELEKELKKTLKEADTNISDKKLREQVDVKVSERGVEITLGDRFLFPSGDASIRRSAYPLLKKVTNSLTKVDNSIIVEGHTDNVPISSVKYPSNWELSSSRAANIVKFLINEKKDLQKRISLAGYGETKPIANNSSADGRRKNRRVVIVILKSFDERMVERLLRDKIESPGR